VMSFRLYRECAGAVRLGSKMRLIAGAFPIRRLVLRLEKRLWGLVSKLLTGRTSMLALWGR
jgi:hypothetical protein